MSWWKPWTWGDDTESANTQRANMDESGNQASLFADQAQGSYGAMTGELAKQRQFLMDLASGKNSIAAEQLRQGLQQNVAAQQSMAAGASPQNAGMAARSAMLNTARLGSGMAGQQALAGLKERQDAQQALAGLNLQQRGQDVTAALGSRGNAINAYGGIKPEKSFLDKWGPAVIGAIAASDRRLKRDGEDGDDAANATLKALKSRVFSYKSERHGKGRQLGIMAQDLEKNGLAHAVIDTPEGKAVHGAKLATSNTAMLGALARRVEKLEGKGRK